MNVKRGPWGIYIMDNKGYTEWGVKSLMFLQSLYPNHPQTERFDFWVKKNMCDKNECK